MSLKYLHRHADEPFKGLELNWGEYFQSTYYIIFYIYHISLIDLTECMGNGVRVDDGHIYQILTLLSTMFG